MLGKYRYHMNDMLTYIVNRVNAGAAREQVCVEVQKEFAPQIALYRMDKEMIYEVIGLLWDLAYFITNKEFHKE
jgi:hypothetical protein